MGEIVKTLKLEAEIIDTLFSAYDLLKDRPFLHSKGIAGVLGIREKAARRYKEYAGELGARISAQTQRLSEQVKVLGAENQRLKAENAELFELLETQEATVRT